MTFRYTYMGAKRLAYAITGSVAWGSLAYYWYETNYMSHHHDDSHSSSSGHAHQANKRLYSGHLKIDDSIINKLRLQNLQWQQTMLRIKDADSSIKFYTNPDTFNMKLLHKYHFKDFEFDLYFLATKDPNIDNYPSENATFEETENFLWNYPGVVLELTHNYNDSDTKDRNFVYNNGNIEPNRGFGHIAFDCNNVENTCNKVENTFKHLYNDKPFTMWQKKLTDGKMKSLAFVRDLDSYWIELINRKDPEDGRPGYPKNGPNMNFSQTMLRVKNPEKSLAFYRDLLGMKVINEKHFPQWKFSLYFLAQEEHIKNGQVQPIIELTHNHGTETDKTFWYHNGNDKPQGFGHIGFLCDNLDETCKLLEKANVEFKKKPNDGKMKNIAFAVDPDGYWVELIPRGLKVPNAKFDE